MELNEQQQSNEHLRGLSIKRATPEQARSLIEIQQQCYLQSYVHPEHGIDMDDIRKKVDQLGKDRTVESIAKRVDNPNEHWLVAKAGEKVVGFIEAKVSIDDEPQRISRLFVLPEYQGKGVGGNLMQQALFQLDQTAPVALQVDQFNDNTINFYRRFGFQDSGEGKAIKITDSKSIPTREMVLDRHPQLPSVDEFRLAITARADVRRRELAFDQELDTLAKIQHEPIILGPEDRMRLEHGTDPELLSQIEDANSLAKKVFLEQYSKVLKVLHVESNSEQIDNPDVMVANYVHEARSYQDWAPNMAALYLAKAALIEQSSGRDPSNLLAEARHFIDDGKSQGIPKTTPGDFLPDALVLGVQRQIIQNTILPTPNEVARVIVDDPDLLDDYALVLPENQRTQFLEALPEENRMFASLRLDTSVSEVLKTASVHTEDDVHQRDLVKYRTTKAFLKSLKSLSGEKYHGSETKFGDEWTTQQIVETLTNLGGNDSLRLLRSMSERTTKDLKEINKRITKEINKGVINPALEGKKKNEQLAFLKQELGLPGDVEVPLTDEMIRELRGQWRDKLLQEKAENDPNIAEFIAFTGTILDTLADTDESIRGGVLAMRFLEMTALPPEMFDHFCQKLIAREYFTSQLADYLADSRNISVLKKVMGKYGTQFNTIIDTLHQIPNYSLADNELEIFAALSDLETLTPRIYDRYRSKSPEDRRKFAEQIRSLKPQFFRNVPIKSILDRHDQDILAEMVYHSYKPVDMTYDKVAEMLRNIPDCTEHLDGYNFPQDGYELNLTGPVSFVIEKGKSVDMSRLRNFRELLAGERLDRKKPYAENFTTALQKLVLNEQVQGGNERNPSQEELGVILSILNGEHRGQASFVQDFLDRFPQVTQQDAYGYLQGLGEIYGIFFDDNFEQTIAQNLRQTPELSDGLTKLFSNPEFRDALSQKMQTMGERIDWNVFERSLQQGRGLTRFLGNRGQETAQQFMASTITRLIKTGYIETVRKEVYSEMNKFVATTDEGKVVRHGELKFFVTKNAASFFAKASAGLCTKEQIDPFTDWENLFNLPIVENESVVRGMVEARVVDVKGKPSLVLRAINPNADWVDKVNIPSLWESILKASHQFTRENPDRVTDNIYIVQNDDWHPLSNRSQVSSYLEQKYIKNKQGVSLSLQVAANHSIQKIYPV